MNQLGVNLVLDLFLVKALKVICNLTLSRRRPLSYRNQCIDLLRKLVEWFLYDSDLRLERVNNLF